MIYQIRSTLSVRGDKPGRMPLLTSYAGRAWSGGPVDVVSISQEAHDASEREHQAADREPDDQKSAAERTDAHHDPGGADNVIPLFPSGEHFPGGTVEPGPGDDATRRGFDRFV